jgi:hypothetical protein
VHEIKHDGCRLIVRRDGGAVRLFTRRGYDWSVSLSGDRRGGSEAAGHRRCVEHAPRGGTWAAAQVRDLLGLINGSQVQILPPQPKLERARPL